MRKMLFNSLRDAALIDKQTIFLMVLVLTCLVRVDALAQEEAGTKKNTVYAELGGNAALYSINYDRLLLKDVSVRAGIGVFTLEDDLGLAVSITAIPVTGSYLLGNGPNKAEVGLGILIVSGKLDLGTISDSGVLGTGILGYRHQKEAGGIMFKAAITPIFGHGEFLFWVGAGVGYTF